MPVCLTRGPASGVGQGFWLAVLGSFRRRYNSTIRVFPRSWQYWASALGTRHRAEQSVLAAT